MEKIQWHPAFCAAAGLEFSEDLDTLELISEYNLSKEPIRIDLLILKDACSRIKNEIGHIMRKYNVIEYKSPTDGLSIDDFYKTLGYACLYKGYGEKVNAISSDEITISLFRDVYPRELIDSLKCEGYSIDEVYPGIYYVNGSIPFPAQIVVTSRLNKNEHSSLRILSNHVQLDDVERFMVEAQNRTSQGEIHKVSAVLLVSSDANPQVYEEIRKDTYMGHVWEELMKDVIEERVSAGEEKGAFTMALNNIKNGMKNSNLSFDGVCDLLGIQDKEKYRKYI